jgi:acyl-CoA reductase-like NAD-dependent aldehyde dehydrogenase
MRLEARSIEDQVRQARTAQPGWEAAGVPERLAPVRALRHLLVEESTAFCAAVGRDVDRPAAHTLLGEVLPLADACRFLERAAARLLQPRRVPLLRTPPWLWAQRDTVHRRPRGLVGIIGTWNYPLFLNGVQIVQALTAGNAVLWKPSEVAPHTASALYEMLLRAGYSRDLIGLLPATRETGAALAEAAIDHVVFTGSARTGRLLARRLGERLISSTLELSGCDAQIVLDDADVALAARAAWFATTVNRGQTCIAVRRAFVQRAVYAPFCAALRALAAAAPPVRLTLPGQAEQAEHLIADALARGGHLLVEPAVPRQLAAWTPTVVVDARPDMALCREDCFAPLVGVLPFDTLDEVVEQHAASSYGLGASIFTGSPRRAEPLAARLRVGMVAINDVIMPTAHPATPFGGRGASGWGVTQGTEGLLEMTVPQVVARCRGSFRRHYALAAGGPEVPEDLGRGLLESGHGRSWWRRLAGWRRLWGGWRRMPRG